MTQPSELRRFWILGWTVVATAVITTTVPVWLSSLRESGPAVAMAAQVPALVTAFAMFPQPSGDPYADCPPLPPTDPCACINCPDVENPDPSNPECPTCPPDVPDCSGFCPPPEDAYLDWVPSPIQAWVNGGGVQASCPPSPSDNLGPVDVCIGERILLTAGGSDGDWCCCHNGPGACDGDPPPGRQIAVIPDPVTVQGWTVSGSGELLCTKCCASYAYIEITSTGICTVSVTLADMGCGNFDGPCTLTVQFRGICCPPVPTLDPNPICADGESTSIAEVRARRRVYFKLEDNEEGCQLTHLCPTKVTPDTCDNEYIWRARIRSGTAPGNGHVWVVAYYADDESCAGRALLELICTPCAVACSAGSGRARNGSVELELLLGKSIDGKSAGKLWLVSEEPGADLVSPTSLIFSARRSDVIVRRGADGAIEQIKAPQILASIADSDPDDRAYEVQFFKPYQVSNWGDAIGPWLPGGIPYTTWAISSPDSSFTQLVIDEKLSEIVQRTYHYTYSSATPGIDWQWQMTVTDPASALLRAETVAWHLVTAGEWTRTTVVEQDGGIVEKIRETLTEINGDKRVILRVVDPDGAALTTYFGYYNEFSATPGFLKYVDDRSDGSWRWRTYESDGRLSAEITPWCDFWTDMSAQAPDPGLARRVLYTYVPGQSRPSEITEFILGQVVGQAQYQYTVDADDNVLTRVEHRSVNPSSSPPTFLTTTTTYDPSNPDWPLAVVRPDGQKDTYVHERGDYDNTQPLNRVFTPNTAGRAVRTTITHGTSASPSGIANLTTREIRAIDDTGNSVFDETYVYAGGTTYELIDWRVGIFDDVGRLRETHRADGTVASIEWSDCCGEASRTDATGILTTFVRDLLGRVTQQTKVGVAASGSYSAQPSITATIVPSVIGNHIVTTTSVNNDGPGGETLVSSESRDIAGRIVTHVDPAGLTTTYADGTSGGGGRVVTATLPGGAQEVTEYYRDGRIKSVLGSSVLARTYQYGVSADAQWTQVYDGPLGASSPRWARTTYDPIGRVKVEERPAYNDSSPVLVVCTYDDSATGGGRLGNVQSFHAGQPLGAPTVYEYDEVGRVKRTGLDLSGSSGVLDNASTDRIAETSTKYVNLSGSWWSETVKKVYRTDNNGTATTQSTVRERLTGLPGGTTPTIRQTQAVDFIGNTTTTTTILDRTAKLITETIDFPATANNATRAVRNGVLQSVVDKAQLATSFEYDGLGRRTETIDSRSNWTRTNYDPATGQVTSDDNNHGDVTAYAYFTAAEPNAGRIKSIRNANSRYTYFDYNPRGETTRTWGDVPQPTWIEYDDYGQQIALHTYRGGSGWSASTWPSSPGDDDVTARQYDPATGLLERKTYDDQTFASYTYTSDGQLGTRTWARLDDGNPLVTTYAYSTGTAGTGELLSVAYSDATPDVDFTYNRLGDQKSARQFKGQTEIEKRTFTYATSGPRLTEVFDSGPLAGKQLRTRYQDTVAVDEGGGKMAIYQFVRLSDVAFGTTAQPTADYSAVYDYDGDTDRMTKVTGPGLPSGGANYKYLGQLGSASPYPANLAERIEFKDGSTTKASIVRTYETQRNLLTAVENQWGASPVTVSRYAYENDSLGRHQWCTRTGAAFDGLNGRSPAHTDVWTHNDRNELTASDRFDDVSPPFDVNPQPALDRGYECDPIGNRTSSTEGANTSFTYTRNNLNQYRSVLRSDPASGQGLLFDEDGNLRETYVAGDINGDGNVDLTDLSLLQSMFGLHCGDQLPPGVTAEMFTRADANGDCMIDIADQAILLSYFGSSGGSALQRQYIWDAENRLIRVEPAAAVQPVGGDIKVEFAYDYAGRRSEKKVWTWNPALGGGAGDWELTDHRRFIWFQRLLLMELRASDNVVLRKYTWGLDVQGQSGTVNSIHEAAGIGGLLALQDTLGTSGTTDDHKYVYFYDANGNVGQLVDLAASDVNSAQVARYEYDAYGNNLLDATNSIQSGAYAAANPFRFSTKFFDPELGTYAYPMRIYDPKWGRWLSRDPLEELDGPHLYKLCANAPTDIIDPDGRYIIALGGADGLGDGPFRATISRLAAMERAWYRAHRPCTVFLGSGFNYISAPTGAFGLIAPNWDRALRKLRGAIQAYDVYRRRVEERRARGECICPEYLHVVGFSDGASTIGLWLNEGAVGASQWPMGLIGTVDLVRIGRRDPLAPNRRIGTPYYVDPHGVGNTWVNIWNHTPEILVNPLVFGQGGWTGHFLPGWSNFGNDDGTAHTDFPGHRIVFEGLGRGLFENALPLLAESCICPCEEN